MRDSIDHYVFADDTTGKAQLAASGAVSALQSLASVPKWNAPINKDLQIYRAIALMHMERARRRTCLG